MMKYQYVWGEYQKDLVSEETKKYFVNKLEEQSSLNYHCGDNMVGETEESYFSRTPLVVDLNIDPYCRIYFKIPGHEELPEKIYLEVHVGYSLLAHNPKKKTEYLYISGFKVSLLNINDLCFIKNIRYILINVDTCSYTGYILCPAP